jgi:peptidoglycan/LPS O-acetylase OafA/YrhL
MQSRAATLESAPPPSAARVASPADIGYRPEIDGLRAVAVLPVVLYHAGLAGFDGGFVGVDVFFVISGFLITSILKREIDAGRFSLLGFYERRARRIVPALFVMSAVTAYVAYRLLPPEQVVEVGKGLVAVALFVSNIYFWAHAGYWDAAAREHPLLHTWSLGVEEQFYIVFPWLLAGLRRWAKPRAVPLVLGAIAAVSLAGSVWAAAAAPQAGFYLSPFRAFELMIGALLVYAPSVAAPPGWVREAASGLGLALIAAAVVLFSEATPFPGAAALVPCVGAALAILGGGASGGGRLLSLPPMRFVGLISYSLYLWHWPLIVFAKFALGRPFTLAEQAGLVAASIVAATLSWAFVERPFRRRGKGFPGRRTAFGLVGAFVLLALLGAQQAIVNHGWPNRLPGGMAAIDVSGGDDYAERTCMLGGDQPPIAWQASRCVIAGGGAERVLWWGDSFAGQYRPALEALGARLPFSPVLYSYAGCAPAFGFKPPISPQCPAFNEAAWGLISENHVRVVVLAARWEAALKRGLDLKDLTRTVEALRAHGLTVVVVGESPVFASNGARLFAWRRLGSHGPAPSAAVIYPPDLNARVKAAAPGVIFVDPSQPFCTVGKCRLGEGRTAYFVDEGHMTRAGGLLALSAIEPAVAAAVASAPR